jgi:hypothetical protein
VFAKLLSGICLVSLPSGICPGNLALVGSLFISWVLYLNLFCIADTSMLAQALNPILRKHKDPTLHRLQKGNEMQNAGNRARFLASLSLEVQEECNTIYELAMDHIEKSEANGVVDWLVLSEAFMEVAEAAITVPVCGHAHDSARCRVPNRGP